MTDQLPDTSSLECPKKWFARFSLGESGQDLIEYALAAALVGLSAVSGMNGLATSIANSYKNVAISVTSSVPQPTQGQGHDHND